ncbi:glycoside hydrolase family 113 [Tenacibaculum agarivorans]|uniref:glycoside hydrolase family 113 n=1 Tax=Tenacibaculum agarivorans TaxID=1908389 RepID=UPI00094B9AEC|nr:glycoside hydrolase [Tenacibaculum agarivorans]
MKIKQVCILPLLILFLSCSGQHKKVNGLSFVASSEAINNTHIQPVKKASANYVSLMPFGFIKDLKSPEVRYNESRQWFGETKKGVKQYASEFRNTNIKLMIKPQIWVWRGEFTGYIEMNTEENWKLLEESYKSFILDYAEVAEEIKAEIFCIGTELEQFVINRPEYWKNLIQEIKKIYSGKLTYAANWDEFKRVPFWNQLDFIGVDAYFPLSEKKSPTVDEFEQGWQPHKKTIKEIYDRYKKPILFTEFGYRSVNFTGKEPWSANRISGEVNLKAQENATQAIYNQFWKEKWFAGGFLWKWFHNHNDVGGKTNNRFTPQNKPTEKLIQQLYAQ